MDGRPSAAERLIQVAAPQTTAAPAGRFRFLSREALAALPAPTYLVDQLLPQQGVCLGFGESGCGKTFLAIDLSCAIATGQDFFGHETIQGVPLLLVGEGYYGIPKRLAAWETLHQIAIGPSDLFVTDARPRLAASEDVTALIDSIKALGIRPSLAIVDTLATHFPGGNENEAKDVGLFLDGARRLADAFECLVLVIHHTIKDGTNFRGSYALKANVDTLLRVEKSAIGACSVVCEKQKDFAEFEPLTFYLQEVHFPDSAGADQSSLVVVEAEAPTAESLLGERPLSDFDKKIIAILEAKGPLPRKQLFAETGIPEGSIDRLLRALRLSGHVTKEAGKRGLWSRTDPDKTIPINNPS